MSLSQMAIAGLVLLPLSIPASAAPLYVADSASHLLKVDVATAQTEEVFAVGAQLTDIAFSSTDRLYGITRDYLYEINPTDGWSRLVGPHGYGGLFNPYGLDSLAFGADGVLYAAGNNILVSIDTQTGTGTRIGSLSGHLSAGDLAVDNRGRLLLTTDSGSLVEVDPNGGGASVLGRLPYNDIYAMATEADGTLYGIRSTNQILRIDPDTCAVAAMGVLHANTLIGRAWGAAFPVAQLPEPATALLLVLCASTITHTRRHPQQL